MYLSHPVRRMRDDPTPDESVGLVVTAADEGAIDDLETAVQDAGGEIERRLQFGAVLVRIPQERVGALCDLSGIESIETEHAVGIGGDAGEDLGEK